MVKTPSVDKNGMKKGLWSEEEDYKLRTFVQTYGHDNWRQLPKFAGLSRCGKSCRLRWMNYLRPGLKKGNFSKEEDELIIKLHKELGKKWSFIAAKLPGRSDNEVKNHWHTHLKKRAKENQKTEQSMGFTTSENSGFEFNPDNNMVNPDDALLPEISQTVNFPPSAASGGMSSSSSSSSISTIPNSIDWLSDDRMISSDSFMDPLESFWNEPFIAGTLYGKNIGYSVPFFEAENFPVLEGDFVPPYFEDAWY